MDWLLNLIPGGGITAAIVGILAALGTLFGLFKSVQKTGVDKRKAQEAKEREKVIDRLAAGAAAKPRGSVLDDPHNRDNRTR